MRLPILNKDYAQIDEAEAIRMIRKAIDNGVNYVDTASPYHMGNSEKVVGKALRDGYRQKVKLATKLSYFMLKSGDDIDQMAYDKAEKIIRAGEEAALRALPILNKHLRA